MKTILGNVKLYQYINFMQYLDQITDTVHDFFCSKIGRNREVLCLISLKFSFLIYDYKQQQTN